MKLAHVIGTVEASAKDQGLSGLKLLLTDLVDGTGAVIVPAFVAVDTVGAGIGDKVLITFNDAARMPSAAAGAPTDATIVAVVDRVSLAAADDPAGASKPTPTPKPTRRKP